MKETFPQVIIVASQGRKRDTLVVMLRSVLGCENVLCVDSALECVEMMLPDQPVLILLDHSISKLEMMWGVKEVRSKNPQAFTLFLLPHPFDNRFVMEITPDGVIYDDFSPDQLLVVVNGIHPGNS